MKNYKDMADAVFARRDEYVASVKRKKKIALNASLSLCTICLAVLGAFGIWKSGVLTPDPNVIGTKPHSYTEPTEVTLSGNATSQGEHSDTAEHITGNTKPQGTTGNIKPEGTNPTENAKPQPTDPAERPDAPGVKPTPPAVKPILPTLPTLPIGPNLPNYPNIPPTSGDNKYPKPTIPSVIVTDPVETEPTEGNPTPDLPITSPDVPTDKPQTSPGPGRPPIVIPDVTMPPQPATNATDSDEPEGEIPPQWAPPTEPLVTQPCWTEAPCTEPTMGWEPETQVPMEPTVPDDTARPDEATVVEGVVVDQYGNPVKGAVIMVYSGGKLAGTYTTGSNGYYCISGFRNYPPNLGYGSDEGNYIGFSSLPDGYSEVQHSKNFSGSYNYIVLTCNKN